MFFEIIAFGTLGCTYKFTSPDETIEIETATKKHKIYPIEEYKIYEILRNLRRKVDIIETSSSPMSWIFLHFG